MKIDENFQYDAFRFMISGVRNSELERFFGLSTDEDAEKSIQGWFERTQLKIAQLPQLLDPKFAQTDLDKLLALVGWDGTKEVDFLGDVDDSTKRKLIALSVPLWKLKGTDKGLIGALRIFTGKTVIVRNWFFHRWIMDEAGFWYEGNGSDLWMNGGRYSEADEFLQWIILNRSALEEVDRRLIYDLTTFLRGSGEHFGIIYAAFADDFGRGFASDGAIAAVFPQWRIVGSEALVEYNPDVQKAELSSGGKLRAKMASSELNTWGPTQRAIAEVLVGSTPEHVSAGAWAFELSGMISEDLSRYYSAKIDSSGVAEITRDGSVIVSGTFTPPIDGTSFTVELKVEPTDSATVLVSLLVGANLVLSTSFVGALAYDNPNGSVTIASNDGTFFVDNVIVLATPNRVQYVGQKAIAPVAALGGPVYVANPDPGVEEFEG